MDETYLKFLTIHSKTVDLDVQLLIMWKAPPWGSVTEELYKKDHDPDNHDAAITHLEPGILNAKSSEP